ncbi:hypothetical protein AYO20_06828 [Fonsecaea nubica]|uniref:Galactosyl transferase GMA12/MNN10 family protein n=1 Tax=Fonsecaea nubica TaxID=856822 RepID=A0A178CWJ2_9EURO|nr:hypothetical protein AYO20_06828 [Fonsecaea nubica]OAL33817.1 hypothetical protein AYO20_06828 [Fonsecaea nubica]
MAKRIRSVLVVLVIIAVLQLLLSHLGPTAPQSQWRDLSSFQLQPHPRRITEQASAGQELRELEELTAKQDEVPGLVTQQNGLKTPSFGVEDKDDDDEEEEETEVQVEVEDDNDDSNSSTYNKPHSEVKIAKVTMLYGEPNDAYERALESHALHANMHGYQLHVLRQKMLGRLWTKPAFILSVVLNELAKPPEARIEWIFWFDADTFLLNPKIPLEIYLPPADVRGVNFLCGNDHNGLNDGAFLLRVNDYSVHLLASSLSVETFRPNVDLRYSEQSAIEHVVHEGGVYRPWDGTTYLDGYAEIPQRWLNAYMGARNDRGRPIARRKQHLNGVKPGDLLLHFAGSGSTKVDRIKSFVEAYEQNPSEWVKEVDQMPELLAEISKFWDNYRKQKSQQNGNFEVENLTWN